MADLDPRVVRFGVEYNGKVKWFEGLAITAVGMKYANANQNECEIQVSNLNRETRDTILTETSPFNKNNTPKRMFLDAGRVSYGTKRIFVGDIVAVSVSQPPDITITLKSLTKNFAKGDIVARNHTSNTPMSRISQGVADDLGLSLDFQAEDKGVANYTFTGGALKQVAILNAAGGVSCYVDDDSLIVKGSNVPLEGPIRELNLDSGMIGIPDITEQGVKVQFLLDNTTRLGSGLKLTSKLYPTLNGTYVIYKLGFNVASRDVPFYWIATCKRIV